MSIAETILTAEELEAEIQRDLDERYAFARMLAATDRVLWRLEELNRDGIGRLPGDMRALIKGSLTELPSACMEVFRESEHVQEVLDSVFAVQDLLLARYVPGYDPDEAADGE